MIARIDDGDYRLAVADRARPDRRAAGHHRAPRPAGRAQQAAVDQAKAQLASAKAGATRADLELKRQQDLATRQINSQQTLEQAQANYDQAVAAVQAAQAAIEAASANVDVLKAQQEEAARTLKQLQTALAKAERDLSFTIIRAPFDGVIGNRAMQVGDYVQPTQRLASLVPLDAVYIDANFKETQLAELHPGQPVEHQRRRPARRTLEGTRGERRAGFRLGVLAAAARQRDRQFHQDRAAPAGAHPGAGRRRRAVACCGPACRWS